MKEVNSPELVDAYILGFSTEIQERLNAVRQLIKELAPMATEKISYGIPTFFFKENLVHYAAFKKHIGFYPTPQGIVAFQEELSVYKGAKGSAQFPYQEPLPMDLIEKIVRHRIEEVTLKYGN